MRARFPADMAQIGLVVAQFDKEGSVIDDMEAAARKAARERA